MTKVNNKLETKDLRKKLRRSLTTAEARLWIQLKGSKLGKKFRRQHSIDRFILDFYCPELKLALELDGATHNDPKQYEHD